MKNSALALGVFTACIFIGVGFLSGKETALFFLPYNNWVYGLILNSVLLLVFSFISITYFQKFKTNQKFFKVVGYILSLVIITITVSGIGEVFNLLFNLSPVIGSLIASVLLFCFNQKLCNC